MKKIINFAPCHLTFVPSVLIVSTSSTSTITRFSFLSSVRPCEDFFQLAARGTKRHPSIQFTNETVTFARSYHHHAGHRLMNSSVHREPSNDTSRLDLEIHMEQKTPSSLTTSLSRRTFLSQSATLLLSLASALTISFPTFHRSSLAASSSDDPYERVKAAKSPLSYPDFILTDSGMQYKDRKVGTGAQPEPGDRCVIDWEGYTVGYYGRPFEAKNKTTGGAFADDKEYDRFVLGDGTVIKALEEAVAGMKVGGVRQIIVPEDLGYLQKGDPGHKKVGPRPKTFSGQRALDFVIMNNGLIDKTLLINVELIRVDKPGERGFKKD